eukprot:TRINITY_DN15012_c0_g3_i1.p1 TRINITY_DN15012_c0_g3~~TRINITY_DN15012_c0_g3_i1.p1  ORF type:complete len:660 (+),score=82.43 TRINITY_DN15012_c0_g3_i1:209-1981(+)
MTMDPYGFSGRVAEDTGKKPIQHDVLTLLGDSIQAAGERVRYMEIGVSILKSIYTQSHFWHDALITAVDIEDPNPTIESQWKNKQVLAKWEATSAGGDMRRHAKRPRKHDFVYRYDGPQKNTMYYVAGDAFNTYMWDRLHQQITAKEGPMNLVLSDGLHIEAAVLAEVKGLLKRGIIKADSTKPFAMVWDDCDQQSGIQRAVLKTIIPQLNGIFGASGRKVCSGIFKINGWIGDGEPQHNTCIFTTMKIDWIDPKHVFCYTPGTKKKPSPAPVPPAPVMETPTVSGEPTREALVQIGKYNRIQRNHIKSWASREAIQASIFGYGMTDNPYGFVEIVNRDVGSEPIQHDVISLLGACTQAAGERVRYMEVGVSVLKNIHTQSMFLQNAFITAVDIEDPNPTIESRWTDKEVVERWSELDMPTPYNKDMRRNATEPRPFDYVNRYKGPRGNTMYYATGDAFNKKTWVHLRSAIVDKEGPMNLVLSDGLHIAQAVLAEADGLFLREIIKEEPGKPFSMVWDDCETQSGIQGAVLTNIIPRLRREFEDRRVCYGWFEIGGWTGVHEKLHPTCIFTTFDVGWLDAERIKCEGGSI